MASIGDTTRPAFAYDQATDTWVPVGIGPHSHTAAGVGAVATSSFAAKGDLLVGTGAGTLVAQSVGANGTVLTADSAEADGVKWAVPSSGGMTLLSTTTLSGATDFQVTSISGSYQDLYILILGAKTGTESNKYRIFINNTSGTNTNSMSRFGLSGAANNIGEAIQLDSDTIVTKSTTLTNSYAINIFGYANTAGFKPVSFCSVWNDSTTKLVGMGAGSYTDTAAITSVQMSNWAGVNFTGGTMYIYGVK